MTTNIKHYNTENLSTSFVLKGVTSEPKDVSSASISLSFYAPFYYGVSDKVTLEEADIKALTKLIEGKGNKTFKFPRLLRRQ